MRVVLCFMLGLLLPATSLQAQQSRNMRAYPVQFEHKGSVTKGPEKNILHESLNEKGREYYMDVRSVFCGENVCKVDRVRLFWNELGDYQRFSLGKGIRLEKGNAEDFSDEDYLSLDTILRNKQSGLASLEKSELVIPNEAEGDVDGFTGATTYIHRQDYIEGAIWTCYTLWHFANGAMPALIRDISARHYSDEQLVTMLSDSSNSQGYARYAIEQLTRRNNISKQVNDVILQQSVKQQAALDRAILDYLLILPSQDFERAVLALISGENDTIKQLVLNEVDNEHHMLSNAFYVSLSEQLAVAKSYPQVSVMLEVLKQTNAVSNDVNQQVLALLEHDNFIIARSAFWFLKNQKMTADMMIKVDDFYRNNENRL